MQTIKIYPALYLRWAIEISNIIYYTNDSITLPYIEEMQRDY